MTYDERDRRLHVVEGWRNEPDVPTETLQFALPFGVGLAGACFKRADRAFLHVHDRASGDRPPRTKGSPGAPEYFIEIPGHPSPGVILAVPLDHPAFDQSFDQERRSQQCIGVIDITSNFSDATLLSVVQAATSTRMLKGAIPALCRSFTRDLTELLHVGH
jgi:hypothetical protein